MTAEHIRRSIAARATARMQAIFVAPSVDIRSDLVAPIPHPSALIRFIDDRRAARTHPHPIRRNDSACGP
ncbi:hypothetical protein [Burkholderia alba]|uniref:hypothetical protein n=1 Tax=Burkholderia alba TaxID=2683677 RepID=UPI002B05A21F|nr:hypothetical protein [Burkholderia alba]